MKEVKDFLLSKENAEQFKDAKKVSPEAKAMLENIYNRVLRKQMRVSCSSCYHDAFTELYTKLKKDEKAFFELYNTTYRLHPGEVLTTFGDAGKNVTNLNLTDKLAKAYLKDNPALASKFAVIPGEEKEEVNPLQAKVEDLQNKLKAEQDAHEKTKQQLKEKQEKPK